MREMQELRHASEGSIRSKVCVRTRPGAKFLIESGNVFPERVLLLYNFSTRSTCVVLRLGISLVLPDVEDMSSREVSRLGPVIPRELPSRREGLAS
jgi:hypothetical protein